MRPLFLILLVWFWNNRSLDQISRNNVARKDAEVAYLAADYKQAVDRYTYLTHTLTVPDPAIQLNLGHAYFRLGAYEQARKQYAALLQLDKPDLSAIAAIQLGVIACVQRDSATALGLFRQALLIDPNSEAARYDFELIRKTFSGKKVAPGQKPKPKPTALPQQVTSTPKRALDKQVEQSSRKDEQLRRFRALNMTRQQALQLLNTMQGNDLPYSLARRRAQPQTTEADNQW